MSDAANKELLELIDRTLAWASEVSEMWTGTIHASIIDSQMAQLTKAVEVSDMGRAHRLVHILAQSVKNSQEEYEKVTH